MPSAGIATKTSGHAKGFPPSPAAGHPPTPPFQKLRNVIEPLSGGLGGKPFAQHYSCPACFRCSEHRTVAAFWGTIFMYESCFLSQWLVSHRTRQQGGSVEPPWSFAYQASLARSLLVTQREEQKAGLAPHRVLLKATLKKWLLPFFLNAPP